VKIFKKIRTKFGYFLLNKKANKLNRIKDFNNFNSAKTIGVIFNASKQDLYLKAKSFIENLSEKKISVSGLGYVLKRDSIEWYSQHKNIDFFSMEELTWYFKPNGITVNRFINTPFDILIDLTIEEDLTLNFIIGLSKARFRISPQYKVNYADFMIKLDENSNIEYFIKQIQHYLSSISKS